MNDYPGLPKKQSGSLERDEESVEYKAAIEELKGDGFQANNDYFLDQLDIMLDEDFNAAMGSGASEGDFELLN